MMTMRSRRGQYEDEDDYPLIVELLIGLGCLAFASGAFMVFECLADWIRSL